MTIKKEELKEVEEQAKEITYNMCDHWFEEHVSKKLAGYSIELKDDSSHYEAKDSFNELPRYISRFNIDRMLKAGESQASIHEKILERANSIRAWIDRYLAASELVRVRAAHRKHKQRQSEKGYDKPIRVVVKERHPLSWLADLFDLNQQDVVDMLISDSEKLRYDIERLARRQNITPLEAYKAIQKKLHVILTQELD